MKEKISRRTTLKAMAASAVAGGAWLTNLAVPELIHAADEALYGAKRAGRNRYSAVRAVP